MDEIGFGTEKDTPMSRPLAAMVEKILSSCCMLPLWEEEEANMIAKSSM